MTVTHLPPDAAVTAAEARHELAVALADAAIWLETNPDAELPDGLTLSKRVRGLTYSDRLAELNRIASSWNVEVETMRTGARIARRSFGPVTLAAVISPLDASYADYLDRIGQRPAAGTEAAA